MIGLRIITLLIELLEHSRDMGLVFKKAIKNCRHFVLTIQEVGDSGRHFDNRN